MSPLQGGPCQGLWLQDSLAVAAHSGEVRLNWLKVPCECSLPMRCPWPDYKFICLVQPTSSPSCPNGTPWYRCRPWQPGQVDGCKDFSGQVHWSNIWVVPPLGSISGECRSTPSRPDSVKIGCKSPVSVPVFFFEQLSPPDSTDLAIWLGSLGVP